MHVPLQDVPLQDVHWTGLVWKMERACEVIEAHDNHNDILNANVRNLERCQPPLNPTVSDLMIGASRRSTITFGLKLASSLYEGSCDAVAMYYRAAYLYGSGNYAEDHSNVLGRWIEAVGTMLKATTREENIVACLEWRPYVFFVRRVAVLYEFGIRSVCYCATWPNVLHPAGT